MSARMPHQLVQSLVDTHSPVLLGTQATPQRIHTRRHAAKRYNLDGRRRQVLF
jgi:hypothetical protein